MESKFLQLEYSLNSMLNICLSREIRIQELQKIKLYTDRLVNLSSDQKKLVMAILEAFVHEISRETICEECIGGFNKILKEILNINRSLKCKKCVVYGDNWLSKEIADKMWEEGYCVFDWHTVNPDYLQEYDLFLLCDEPYKMYDLGLITNKKKLLKLWESLKYKYIVYPSFYASYMEYKRRKDQKVKCLVTGGTNVKNALQSDMIHTKTVSLANHAQDLFYDYQMFLHTYEALTDLQYVLIGLTPYSLRYDASKSKVEWRRCLAYQSVVKTMHNCTDAGLLVEGFAEEDAKIERYFDEEYRQSLYYIFAVQDKNGTDNSNDVYSENARSKELLAMNIRELTKLYNKPDPDILEENKQILEDYVHFCVDKGLKPILFIPPYSEWYKINMKKKYYEELCNVIADICMKYGADCIDLMKTQVPDCCFADYANVNNLGAVKAASHVNNRLE